MQTIAPDAVEMMNEIVFSLPFHRFCGISLVRQEPGKSIVHMPINDNTGNVNGVLHGGVLYAMMDVAAFLALVPLFAPGETAVSHDVHVSVMRPIAKGSTLELRAAVRRRGKSIAFMQVEAWNVSLPEPVLVGTGTVTKSFVAAASLPGR